MSFSNWLTASALAWLPLAAFAQQAQPPSDPSSTSAPVAIPEYQSAFANYLAAPQASDTPDKVWRMANQEVANQGGHGGHAMAPASANNPQPSLPAMPGKDTSRSQPAPGGAAPPNHSSHQHGGH